MEYFDGVEQGLLPDFKVLVLPVGQVYTPGPVTDEQLAEMGLAQASYKLASAGAAETSGLSAGPDVMASADTPAATPSQAVLLMPTCVDLAPVCEDVGTAAAQVESIVADAKPPFALIEAPAPARRDPDPGSMRVVTAKMPAF